MIGKLGIDNPVLRHTGRLASPRRLSLAIVGILALVALGAALLQQYWVQLTLYAGRPRLYGRWFTLFILAEVFIVVPWAAARGAAVWRQLVVDGHLDEYRRTRLSPVAISAGALYG